MNNGEGQVFPPPYGNARRFLGRIVLGPLGPEENKRRFFRSASDGEGQALALR